MNVTNNKFYPLAALILIATGVFSTPASADMDVVAAVATQNRLADDSALLLDVDRKALVNELLSSVGEKLKDRLVSEFESAKRSTLLADEFSEQILESLDERLPEEVDNLISSAN